MTGGLERGFLYVANNPGDIAPGMDEKLSKLPESLTLKVNRPRQVKVAFKKTGTTVRPPGEDGTLGQFVTLCELERGH